MSRRFAGTGLIAWLALLAPGLAAPAADPGLARLQAFLDHTRSMRATFRQEVVDADQKVTEEAGGELLFKRPGRFRWNYHKPYERVVVADGRHLWLYEADLAQVTVRPLGDALGETPAALLSGDRSILDRFTLVSTWSGEQLQWVKLQPRSPESDFSAVAIAFSGDRPVRLVIDDRLGQQTRIFLSDIVTNPDLADAAFEFKVPDGVDVIREGGS